MVKDGREECGRDLLDQTVDSQTVLDLVLQKLLAEMQHLQEDDTVHGREDSEKGAEIKVVASPEVTCMRGRHGGTFQGQDWDDGETVSDGRVEGAFCVLLVDLGVSLCL